MTAIAPSFLFGVALAVAAIWLLPAALEAAGPRRAGSAVLLLFSFAVAAVGFGARDLPLLLRRGALAWVESERLTVFTGRFVTLPLSELVRASGGEKARVWLLDDQGRRIAVRADLADRRAVEIAAAINAQITRPKA